MTRFSRQEIMQDIGLEGQKKLSRSTVAIVGCGALGSVQAELLCRAGVGKLILIDFDVVEESNLQRQALYVASDVGKSKVKSAATHLKEIWPDIEIETVQHYLSFKTLNLLDEVDVVVDGTDNMQTRFLLNECCTKNHIPIVFTSAILDRGNVMVVTKDSACYNCAFAGKHSDEDCGSTGVWNGATHLAATVSATETLKILLGKEPLQGLFSFSLMQNRYDTFALSKKETCAVCNGSYPILEQKEPFTIRYCSRVQGYRADPLANIADKQKVEDGKVDGHEVLVGEHGDIFFPNLKDADIAKRIAEKIQKES